MNSKTLLFFISLITISCSNYKESTTQNPNIVIIMADDLGYGGISCFGNTKIHTPNIDALASEGIRFTDFHSNGSVCSPTRAALLTGKYQQRTGVEGVVTAKSHRNVGLPLHEHTIAEEFKKYGYTTAMFGKWHVGYSKAFNPILQGFDKFTGFVSGNIDYHGHIDQEGYLDWWQGDQIVNEKGYTTDLITNYGANFIEEFNPEKTGKPFFLYLPHEAPHYPFQKRIDKVLREVGKPGSLPVAKDSISKIYKEMVEVMDEGIGDIVNVLKKTNQYNNTIIIFLSDNGASANGDNGGLRGFKASPYEGGSRVPAILSYPNKVTPGQVNNTTVMTMDLLPTLLDIIEQKPEDNIDGISIKDHIFLQKELPKRDLFYSFKNNSFIRSGKWKLIQTSKSLELYDLSTDKQEKLNLVSDHPELSNELKGKLEHWEKNIRLGVKTVSK